MMATNNKRPNIEKYKFKEIVHINIVISIFWDSDLDLGLSIYGISTVIVHGQYLSKETFSFFSDCYVKASEQICVVTLVSDTPGRGTPG